MKKLSIIKKIINARTSSVQTLYYAMGINSGQIWVADITQVLLLTKKAAYIIIAGLDCENEIIDISSIRKSHASLIKGYELFPPVIKVSPYSIKREVMEFTLPEILREKAQ